MRLEGNTTGLQRYMIASQALPRYASLFAMLIWKRHVGTGRLYGRTKEASRAKRPAAIIGNLHTGTERTYATWDTAGANNLSSNTLRL